MASSSEEKVKVRKIQSQTNTREFLKQCQHQRDHFHRNSTIIRNRYLQNLGFDSFNASLSSSSPKAVYHSSSLRTSGALNIIQEPLKNDHGELDLELAASCSQDSVASSFKSVSSNSIASSSTNEGQSRTSMDKGQSRTKKRSVSFDSSVSVLSIPSRNSYSDRIKKQIWINRYELSNNMERNVIEFAAENWDWRQVTEDRDFYLCAETGEWVHPVHHKRMLHLLMVRQASVLSRRKESFLQYSRRAALNA